MLERQVGIYVLHRKKKQGNNKARSGRSLIVLFFGVLKEVQDAKREFEAPNPLEKCDVPLIP